MRAEPRHCERSEAIEWACAGSWIASSLSLFAMTTEFFRRMPLRLEPLGGSRHSEKDHATTNESRALCLTDLAQNLLRMLTQSWRRLLGRHRRAVERDRRAHAGDFAVGGPGARPLGLHAARHHLRMGKPLLEFVNRPGRHAGRLVFFQQRLIWKPRREPAQMPDQLG